MTAGLWHLRPWQRHSLVLLIGGLVYTTYGFYYLVTDDQARRGSALALAEAVALGHMAFWYTVWLIVGGLALVSTRWPPQSKTWGYTALSGLAACWGSVYLLSIVLLGAPTAGIGGALVWYLVAVLWWAISGLINPDDMPRGE